MVRYQIHDGNQRIATAEELAREYAPDGRVQSFISDEYYVVSVDGRQLIIDLRRHKYDVRVDSEIVGKYTSWEDARAKFERLLERATETDSRQASD